VADHRFVLDEQALCLNYIEPAFRETNLETLADELFSLRKIPESVGLLSGWGGIECFDGLDLATVLTASDYVPRDLRVRLLSLLGKCTAWDQAKDIAIDNQGKVNGLEIESFGIGWALEHVLAGQGMAVVTAPHRGHRGACEVTSDSGHAQLCFVLSEEDHPGFYRTLYTLEDIAEFEFFNLAPFAFPNLVFVEGLSFRRFQGGYVRVRQQVVDHLAVLNDDFRHLFESEHGNSAGISARLGIDVSIEGSTRSSEALMSYRDVGDSGRTYRCEWHSKLEPHQNRVHFYPGDETTQGRVLIGIFVDHLPI